MLKYSPPLPLDIDYDGEEQMSTKDEEGALLALQQHHRVRFISLSEPGLHKLLAVADKPFPMLEDLTLTSHDPFFCSRLPETFTAPRLRHLDLVGVGDVFAPGLPLLASITGLVTLTLDGIPSETCLPIKYLTSRLSLMPLLECLSLQFRASGFWFTELERQHLSSLKKDFTSDLADLQIVQLPKLHNIAFRGACTYLEDLVSCIRAPFLTTFTVTFSPRPSTPLPRFSEFLTAAEELRFPVASFIFSGPNENNPGVFITVASSGQTLDYFPQYSDTPFLIRFSCRGLDEQVACAARICTALSPMLSEVEKLHLGYHATRWHRGFPPEIPQEVWLELLRPFCNVKKLQVDQAMTRELSYALCPENGPPPTEGILPKLCKISRPHHACFEGMLDPFIAARQAAGQPIVKRRCPPTSDSESEEHDLEWWLAGDSDEEITTELDSDSDFDSE
jgi:hypothetical protein